MLDSRFPTGSWWDTASISTRNIVTWTISASSTTPLCPLRLSASVLLQGFTAGKMRQTTAIILDSRSLLCFLQKPDFPVFRKRHGYHRQNPKKGPDDHSDQAAHAGWDHGRRSC